jgi:hypothetical protein
VIKCDFFMSLTKIVFLINFLSETCKLREIHLSVLCQVLGKRAECERWKDGGSMLVTVSWATQHIPEDRTLHNKISHVKRLLF